MDTFEVVDSLKWLFLNRHFHLANAKEEPNDDTRNDSGVTSGSECPSASPNSERSVVSPSTRPWYPQPSTPEHKLLEECRVPKVNSHGKVKVHKCKQCEFFAYTKLEFWEHSGVHIKGDKILKCPTCPFVTEYKHHLEYHLLNHAGAKPFKCDHCDYTCVNKSMLKSHLKSHSKIYQYRCANCHYETKYCHSLKLHLRKYGHKPAMVLNPDGTPNPLPVIDVYGTRRGPKVKKQESPQPLQQPMVSPILPPFPLPLLPPNELMMNFQNMFRERLEEMAKQQQQQQHAIVQPPQSGALDLSNKTPQSSEHGDDDDETMTTAFDNVEAVVEPHNNNNNNNKFDCPQCDIAFGDEIMYRIHMGYHGYANPFTCNMCGEECENKVRFFLHIAKAAH